MCHVRRVWYFLKMHLEFRFWISYCVFPWCLLLGKQHNKKPTNFHQGLGFLKLLRGKSGRHRQMEDQSKNLRNSRSELLILIIIDLFVCMQNYGSHLPSYFARARETRWVLVNFLFWCHNSDSRGQIWMKIGHVKATSLRDLPKPKRVQQKH